ncbi:MAG: PAS domain S-box protein [Cyanothece sp. SIO1E1]|nr:PAS domain S-box protein [Cyanothece sp. SIO1E1]
MRPLSTLRKTQYRLSRWLPVLVGVSVSTISLCLWQALAVQERTQIQRKIEFAAANINQEIMVQMQNRIQSLVRMAKRWEFQGGTPISVWYVDAENHIKDYPGFQAIEWVDPSFHVRWIVPLAGNEAAQDLNLAFEERRRVALEMAREHQAVKVSDTIGLVQGGKGFLVDVPIFLNTKAQRRKSFDGFILGVFRVEALLDQLLNENVAPGYAIAIFDNGEEIYRRASTASPLDRRPDLSRQMQTRWGSDTEVNFDGLVWHIQVWPTPALIADERSQLPEVVMIGGLVMAGLLAWATYLTQAGQRHTRQVEAINQKLAHEITERNQAEAQLQLTQERLHYLLASSPAVIYSRQISGNYGTTFISDNIITMFGYRSQEFIEGSGFWAQHIHPDDTSRVFAELSQVFEQGAYTCEYRFQHQNGTYHWVRDELRLVRGAEAEPLEIIGSWSDITDRKQAEAALQESEFKLRTIIENSVDAIMLKDRTGRYLLINPAGANFLGRPIVDILGKQDDELFTPATGRQIMAFDQQVMARGVVQTDEETAISGGVERTYLSTKIPYVSPQGDVLGIIGICRDITNRKHAEQALSESEERFRRALLDAPLPIMLHTENGEVLQINHAWTNLTGYKLQDIPTIDAWVKQAYPDQQLTVKNQITQLYNLDQTLREGEFVITTSTGKKRIWEFNTAPLGRLQDGQRLVISMALDVTERKQAEVELQRQNQRSQLFAELTLKIRQSLQLEEILQTAVTEVQKFLQADRVSLFQLRSDGSGTVVQEAVVPGQLAMLGQDITIPCFQAGYLEQYRQGQISAVTDLESADSQSCPVACLQPFGVRANLVVPILQKANLWGLLIAHQYAYPRQWTGFETELLQQLANQIGIALDQAQLLARETEQRQILARSNQELQEFAYVASHDLQEPLRKIQAFGDRLNAKYGEALTDQGRDYLDRIQNAAGRMQSLINDLLTLSRVTTRTQPFVPINLAQVAQEVLSDLEIQIQQTGGQVIVEALPTIEADPGQIRQLLQNLISNALKFHSPERAPIIRVSGQLLPVQLHSSIPTVATSQFCRLSVADNGIGFDERYLDRIFKAFQRLHGRSEYEGTGMGLAICRKIVERHGGDITATSRPGQGATFIVTLPIQPGTGETTQ